MGRLQKRAARHSMSAVAAVCAHRLRLSSASPPVSGPAVGVRPGTATAWQGPPSSAAPPPAAAGPRGVGLRHRGRLAARRPERLEPLRPPGGRLPPGAVRAAVPPPRGAGAAAPLPLPPPLRQLSATTAVESDGHCSRSMSGGCQRRCTQGRVGRPSQGLLRGSGLGGAAAALAGSSPVARGGDGTGGSACCFSCPSGLPGPAPTAELAPGDSN